MTNAYAMVPSPWIGLVLALAAYRAVRLLGWDDLPPIARARSWALGERQTSTSVSSSARMGLTDEEPEWQQTVFDRPLLAHFIHCPFCLGAHVATSVYLLWFWFPTETMYGAVPFALSAAVGLISKNLDP